MFEATLKKFTDKIFLYIEDYSIKHGFTYDEKFRRFIYFVGYKAMPFIFQIATYFTLFWVLSRVKGKYGFETAVLVCLIMLILRKNDKD